MSSMASLSTKMENGILLSLFTYWLEVQTSIIAARRVRTENIPQVINILHVVRCLVCYQSEIMLCFQLICLYVNVSH